MLGQWHIERGTHRCQLVRIPFQFPRQGFPRHQMDGLMLLHQKARQSTIGRKADPPRRPQVVTQRGKLGCRFIVDEEHQSVRVNTYLYPLS